MLADGQVKRVERSVVVGTLRQYPTKRLAQRALTVLLARVNSPGYRPGKVATLAEFAELWKHQVLAHKKPSTIHAAASHLCHHILPRLGGRTIEEIGREAQQAFITAMAPKMSRKTLLNVLGTLSSMLNTAKKWGYITEGVDRAQLEIPARGLRPPVRSFTLEEIRRIIGAAQFPWRMMYTLAAMAGLRCGELLGLSVEDLNFERREIHVRRSVWRGKLQTPKSAHSEAVLPMPEPLAAMLREYLEQWRPNRFMAPSGEQLGLLFVTRRGNPFIGEHVVERQLVPLLRELDLPRAGFHAFRHAHASLLLDQGASPAVTQAQLRHADPKITLGIYAHVVGDAQREAVEKVAQSLQPRKEILRTNADQKVKIGEWIQ